MAHPFQHRPGFLNGRRIEERSSQSDAPNRVATRHTARRWVRALVVALILVVSMSTAAVLATQTAWFKNWLRGYIVREANSYLNGELSIGRLGGNLFTGVELENIALSMGGRPVLTMKDAGVEYSVFELVSRGLSIRQIRLNQPTIYLWRDDDAWSISKIVKAQRREADRTGPARPIALGDIGISGGSLIIDGRAGTDDVTAPSRIDRLDAKLAFRYEPVRFTVDISHVSFRGADPDLALNSLSGAVSVRNDALYLDKVAIRTAESSIAVEGAIERYLSKPIFKLQVTSDKTSLPEIGRIVPALARVVLQPAYEIKLDGPLDRLGVHANVRSSAGEFLGDFVVDAESPQQSIAGEFDLGHLDLAPILADKAQKSDITANVQADVRGGRLSDFDTLKGTFRVKAPRVAAAGYTADNVTGTARLDRRSFIIDTRARAYGANVTTAGRLALPAGRTPFAYDLRGQVRGLDLRRLPPALKVSAAPTDLNAAYHVVGRGSRSVAVDAELADSTVAGARIAADSTATFSLEGDRIGYGADATMSKVDLQQIGRAFRVRALEDDRYKSALNGHFVVSGHGTTAEELELTANGMLTDSTTIAGHVRSLTFDTTLASDTLRVKAVGAFEDLDPGRVSEKPAINGRVAGDVDVDVTLAGVSHGVTVDGVEAAGRVTLGPSTVGELSIDRAAIEGAYRNASGDIRQFELAGRDLNVQASGAMALNDSGQSNLKVHADTPDLEAVLKLVGQSASGIAMVDATVTGNRTDLHATGKLEADNIAYRNASALEVSSDFTVSVPNLAFAKAQLSATTHGTFVALAGQNVNELTAKTEYRDKQLVFDATAKQPKRVLNVGGSLALNPEQDELRLNRLSLQTQNVEWQTPPGGHAIIRYGGGAVSVQDLRLVNGNQEIAAEGTFGRPDSKLTVNTRDMNLATIDALMLREPMLSGTLNASAEVTGTTEKPRVDGKFDVRDGAFRQVHYESLGGTVDYGGKGFTVDAKLQQSPANWVEAKGYIPVAAFKAAAARTEEHHQPASGEDAFDLHINSTPIDLGLVQGLTTEVINVKGTAQAKVDITGAANDPHPTGTITVENAAFTVKPSGVTYTHLDGRIELEADRIHIVDIEVLDNDQQPLSIIGDLALHEQQLGGVNIDVTARNFKVIKNQFGDMRIDSDVRITGELTHPRIEGELGITSGVINLDPLLESVTDRAGATAPTAYTTVADAAARQADAQGHAPATATSSNAGPKPSLFDALRMNVHLTVANDFVIRSNDLSVPNAPVGLGAVNVTIGGDLQLRKAPGRDVVRVVGTVNTVRGSYDFQGRRFTILRDGTIRFVGGPDLNPDLSIIAQRIIQGVQANVNIQGSLKEPEIVLSSIPPLEKSEILSLIVFNQPINQLGEGQQVALTQRAEQLAAGALAGSLTSSLGRALNLTEFNIQAATETGLGAQVTAGQQLNENLYARVEQGIGDVNTTNIILEYEVARWLRLRTNWLQGTSAQPLIFQRAQDSGVDLLFFFTR
jgi:autotransporter translocation and assembly factor TamB